MMQSLGGVMTGGMPGAGGKRPAARPSAKKRKGGGKGVSGNPAKRNQPAVTAEPATPAACPRPTHPAQRGRVGQGDE